MIEFQTLKEFTNIRLSSSERSNSKGLTINTFGIPYLMRDYGFFDNVSYFLASGDCDDFKAIFWDSLRKDKDDIVKLYVHS